MQPTHCLNCEAPLVEKQKFCANCGQKTSVSRLKLKDVLHDGFHYFTHADKGLIQLLKALVIHPGDVAREYVSGKRKKYFQPLNFFLLTAGLFLFAGTVFHRAERAEADSNSQVTAQTRNMSIKKQEKAAMIKARSSKAIRFMTGKANYIAMLAAPFLTLIARGLYGRSKYNYTEHLIANLYLIGFTNLLHSVIYTPIMFLVNPPHGNFTGIIIFSICEAIYRTFFYYRFINDPKRQDITKTAIKSVMVTYSWHLLNIIVISVYMAIGFMQQ